MIRDIAHGIYKTLVSAVMTYSLETRPNTKKTVQQMLSQKKTSRRIHGKSVRDRCKGTIRGIKKLTGLKPNFTEKEEQV